MQLYDEYLNKFYEVSKSGFEETLSPRAGEPLAIFSANNKFYSFPDVKHFQKFYKKQSETKSLSVFQIGNYHIVFFEDNKVVHNIYEQYGTEPFPYQVLFLDYLKRNSFNEPSILVEFLDGGRIVRVITVIPGESVSVETSSMESPVVFQNFIREKIGKIKKAAGKEVKLFVLGKGGLKLLPDAAVLVFEDLFLSDVSAYVFEEPDFKIKTQKKRDLRNAAGIFAASFLILIFAVFVYNGFKGKTETFNFEGKSNIRQIQKLKTELKIETGKRFLYELYKQPDYVNEIISLLKKFPSGAYVKKISVKGGSLTIIGYSNESYRDYVRVFNILKTRLKGYKIEPLMNSNGIFRFAIYRGINEEN